MNYFIIPGLKKEFVQLKRNLKKDDILKVICEHFNIRKTDLYGKRRFRKYAHPRFVAFLLLHKHTPLNKCEIGELFKMDHTSIVHGIRKIKSLMSDKNEIVDDVVMIEDRIRTF